MMNISISLQIPLDQFHWTPKQLFESMQPGSKCQILFEKFKRGEIESGQDPLRKCFAYGKKVEEMEDVQIEVEVKIELLKSVLQEDQNKMTLLQNLYEKLLKKKSELETVGQDVEDLKANDFREEATSIENSTQEELENLVMELRMDNSDEEGEVVEGPIPGVEFLVDTSEEEEEQFRRIVQFGQ